MDIRIRRVDWEYASLFRIAYRVQTHSETVCVELVEGEHVGRGEALGVSYHGETADGLLEQLNNLSGALRGGISRQELQSLLPPGGARNAIDCALWDLEAKRAGRRAWENAGMEHVHPLTTAYTLSMDAPEAMARAAMAASRYSLLKLKVDGVGDVERIRAVRAAHPAAEIVVDANQAWDEQRLRELTPQLARLGVRLIEQPLPAGHDEALIRFNSPIPICADESCQTSESVGSLVGKYQYANIKLDKTGGLTEALRLAQAAKAHGLKLMVGCMGGSSLSMAPAFVVGQWADVIDLDGPLLAKSDVPDAIRYEGSRMFAPSSALWG